MSDLSNCHYFFFLFFFFFNPEPISLMYPYGDAAGDSSIPYNTNNKGKCLKISIPDAGMLFFGKRHRKLYVSILTVQWHIITHLYSFPIVVCSLTLSRQFFFFIFGPEGCGSPPTPLHDFATIVAMTMRLGG